MHLLVSVALGGSTVLSQRRLRRRPARADRRECYHLAGPPGTSDSGWSPTQEIEPSADRQTPSRRLRGPTKHADPNRRAGCRDQSLRPRELSNARKSIPGPPVVEEAFEKR